MLQGTDCPHLSPTLGPMGSECQMRQGDRCGVDTDTLTRLSPALGQPRQGPVTRCASFSLPPRGSPRSFSVHTPAHCGFPGLPSAVRGHVQEPAGDGDWDIWVLHPSPPIPTAWGRPDAA